MGLDGAVRGTADSAAAAHEAEALNQTSSVRRAAVRASTAEVRIGIGAGGGVMGRSRAVATHMRRRVLGNEEKMHRAARSDGADRPIHHASVEIVAGGGGKFPGDIAEVLIRVDRRAQIVIHRVPAGNVLIRIGSRARVLHQIAEPSGPAIDVVG